VGESYAELAIGQDAQGSPWGVDATSGALIVHVGNCTAVIEGKDRDRFAEAVARAVTPGRVPVKHGPACECTPCLAEPSYRARGQATP